jgi:hypothetical protein
MQEGLGGTEYMTSDDLIVDHDGNWEIILSATPQAGPGNSMLITPQAKALLIRQIFSDWENETEASVQVEVLSGSVDPVEPLTPAKVAVGLNRLPLDIFTLPNLFQTIRQSWQLNDLPAPVVGGFGVPGAGFPLNNTSPGRYDIDPNQAFVLEVEATPTPTRVDKPR